MSLFYVVQIEKLTPKPQFGDRPSVRGTGYTYYVGDVYYVGYLGTKATSKKNGTVHLLTKGTNPIYLDRYTTSSVYDVKVISSLDEIKEEIKDITRRSAICYDINTGRYHSKSKKFLRPAFGKIERKKKSG